MLDKQLTEIELYDALNSLKNDKSPGPNGLTKEFFGFFWDELKKDYMECVKEIRQEIELSGMQKRGAIKISYKKGERTLMKNYRPITLLNIDLKIITKALAKRLSKVLNKLVHPNQTCVPGRHIEENIHIVQNLIDHVNNVDGKMALISIDQEKAFDRMSHKFIIKAFKKMNFGNNFISWIKTIINDTKSFVKINGYETFEFPIERGVRQGCPLSALIYTLTAEVLAENIRKNKKIVGYKYKMKNLNHLEHKLVQYADDTNVCISTIESIKELFLMLNDYEKATNAKINNEKTEALWVGKWKIRNDTPLGLKWTNSHIKFLGIYIGNKVGANGTKFLSELNFTEQIEAIKNKMSYWRGKGISMIGRAKVLNIFILSRLWYRTQVISPTQEHLEKINKLIRDFFWENKKGGRIRQGILNLSFEKGGIQLVDINIKIKTQRIN